MQGLIVIALVAVIIVCGPLVVIWSLNTLFGLGIDYTFWTWCATLILSGVISVRKG